MKARPLALAKVAPLPPPPKDVVEVHDVEQLTEEWRRLHIGVPSASNFSAIMAVGLHGESKTRKSLLYRMAGEVLTNEPIETYTNAAMQRGIDMEAEARARYAFTRDVVLERVGFVTRRMKRLGEDLVLGCSPDALIGDDGVLEIKTMQPDLMIELAERGTFPSEHRAQCQGLLLVTGRQWVDLLVFYRGMPLSLTYRVERDVNYAVQLTHACEVFAFDLKRLVEKIRRMGIGGS